MKTLSKLSIKPENVLKEYELKTLKGGWEGYCFIYCEGAILQGPTSSTSEEAAVHTLRETYSWCHPLNITCLEI